MIVVSSIEGAGDAFQRFHPERVISILCKDASPCDHARCAFDGLESKKHLKLIVGDEDCARSISAAGKMRAQSIIDSFADWDGKSDVLIHCEKGVARSMGAAFILACMAEPETDEQELANRLRKAAPHADPCLMVVAYADELLGRDGRMIDAIEDMAPPACTSAAPVTILKLHA